MVAVAALLLALSASSALSAGLDERAKKSSRCASNVSADKRKSAAKDLAAKKAEVDWSSLRAGKAANVTIPVHFHVIRKSTTVAGGNIADSAIAAQIDVLNDAFVNTTYSFKLVNTTRTTNTNWFRRASPYSDGLSYQTALKNSLRVGNASTLNVYTVGFELGQGQGLLGYATFPTDYTSAPKDDGVVFLHSTVPGGSTANYNLGGTLQHEVGHWVGLYHTFNEEELANTCNGSSDEVEDTPAQLSPTSGCPASRDSCPKLAGLDPIHNFMDYSYDVCYTEFTPGQVERLTEFTTLYRGL